MIAPDHAALRRPPRRSGRRRRRRRCRNRGPSRRPAPSGRRDSPPRSDRDDGWGSGCRPRCRADDARRAASPRASPAPARPRRCPRPSRSGTRRRRSPAAAARRSGRSPPRRGRCPRRCSQSPASAIRPRLLDVGAVKGAADQHHLEAVIIGRIVAAGDHHARRPRPARLRHNRASASARARPARHRRRSRSGPLTSASSSAGELSRPSRPTATLRPAAPPHQRADPAPHGIGVVRAQRRRRRSRECHIREARSGGKCGS